MGSPEPTWVVLMASSPALILGLMLLFCEMWARLRPAAGDPRVMATRLSAA